MSIPTAGGNVITSVGGTPNVFVVTSTGANITGTLTTGTGNANFGNLALTGSSVASGDVQSNANLVANTLTSVGANLIVTTTGNGNIYLSPVNGNVILNQVNIKSLANPVSAQDAATKAYVDNAVAAGLDIHPAVNNDADENLAASYTGGGTTPTWTTITNADTIATGSAHGLTLNNVIVFGSTTNGITAGTPYFVAAVPTTTTIKLALTFDGDPIVLTNGSGLSITSLANSGVGATLTSNTNGPLIIESYTAVLNDRILVLGQTDQTQNGVYYISQVGVAGGGGSPWILTRAADGDTYIPNSAQGLSQGAFFLVISGSDAGEAYVLSTGGTIVFGTTNLTFAQFAQVQIYTAGTGLGLYPNNQFYLSNTTVTAASYGSGDAVATFTVNSQGQLTAAANTAITANAANLTGTTLAATIVNSSLTSVGTLANLSVTGNITAGNVIGPLANGTSNVKIPTADGNVNISAGGNANVFVVTTTGANISGTLYASGNANVGNIGAVNGDFTNVSGNGSALTSITGANVTGTVANATYALSAGTVTANAQPNITSVGTLTSIDVTGNANIGGNLNIGTGSGSNISGANVITANTFVGAVAAGSNTITTTGNISGGNIIGTIAAGSNTVTTTGNISGGNIIGTIAAGSNTVTTTGNISGGNLIATSGANIAADATVGGNIVLTNVANTAEGTAYLGYASVTTSTVGPNITIASVNVAGISGNITGAEFLIKGVDAGGTKYQVTSIHAVTDGTDVGWSVFGGVSLGTSVGSFSVNIVGSTLNLAVTPSSSNTTVFTTQYRLI